MIQTIQALHHISRPGLACRIRRVGIAAALVCCAAICPGQTSPAGEDGAILQSYYSANGLLNRGLYDLAATEYRSFLEQHPDHEKAPVARYGLGVSLHRLGRHDEAVDALEPLKDRRDFEFGAESTTILGQSYLALDRFEPAAESFRRVLQHYPDHELADDAAALLADALYRRGDYHAVADPVQSLIARWPDSPHRERAELLRALAAIAGNDDEAAAQHLVEMLERFPGGDHAARATLLLAQSLHRLDRLDSAAEQYRRVIEGAPPEHAAPARYGLAALLHQQEELEGAADLLDEFFVHHEDHPLSPAAHLLRGRVALNLGDYDGAKQHLQEIDAGDKELADDAAYWLAKAELRSGEFRAAADRLDEALQEHAESELVPEMLYDRAVALSRDDDPESAVVPLQRFLEDHSAHRLAPEATHLAATTLHRLQRYDESGQLVDRFRGAHGDHPLRSAIDFLAIENAFLARDYESATEAARTFLEQHPDDGNRQRARYRLGLALYHQDHYDQAAPILAQVTAGDQLDPAFRPALLALGDLHFQQGRWEEAAAQMTAYLDAGSDHASADDALLKRGLARQRLGDAEAALEDYETLLQRFTESPHRTQAVFEQGQALVELRRFDEAADAFHRLLEEEPESRFAAHALNHLGAIAMRRGEHAAAGAYFGRAVAASSDRELAAEAMLAQGQALVSAQEFEHAEEIFDDYLEQFPSSPGAHEVRARRAVAIARQGRHDEALGEISSVQQQDGESLDVALRGSLAYEKAWALRALKRPEDAAVAYRSLLDLRGHRLHPHALLELAEVESQSGNHEEAAALLRRLLGLDDHGDLKVAEDLREQGLYRLAVAEMELDDHREAAELFERFIADFPESDLITSAHLLTGESLFQSGSHQRAIEHLQDVIDADAAGALLQPALLRLGESYNVLQNWSDAERAFAAFLDRFPDAETWYQAQFGIGWARENLDQYEPAIDAYREVVRRHEGPTAARAQFQIGESLFALRRLEDAARELLKVDILYDYPEWSAAALYEAGRCFQEMSDPVQARDHYRQVTERYSDTRWAQLAAQRLEELSRSGLPGQQ